MFSPEFDYAIPPGGGAPSWATGLAMDLAVAGGRATQAEHVADAIRNAGMKPVQDRLADYTYTYQSGCWNQSPCSSASRFFRYSLYSLIGTYTLVKDGKPIQTKTDSLGTVKIPFQAFRDENPVVNCVCQLVPEQRRELRTDGTFTLPRGSWTHGIPNMMLPTPATEGEKGTKVGGLFIDPVGDGQYAAAGDGSAFSVTTKLTAKDLNNFEIGWINDSSKPVNVALMPGTTFEPSSQTFQSMVNLDLLKATLQPGERATFTIPSHGPASFEEVLKGYMACLDMAKKQPDGTMAYRLGSAGDATLVALGHAMAQQRFRGPWNQAQLWAYRDGASIDQINERLGIGVSTSHYLVGIYELAHLYGVPLDEGKYKGVWDPKLLLAHAAEADQIEWLVEGLTRHDAKGLAAWVRKNVGAFAPLFEAGGQEWYVPHAAHVATSLCHATNADVQAAGLEFLEKGVPAAARARMLEAGGLDGLVQLAWSAGPNQKRALAVAELFDPELAKDLKTPPDPNAPMPEVKPPPQRHRASSKSFP